MPTQKLALFALISFAALTGFAPIGSGKTISKTPPQLLMGPELSLASDPDFEWMIEKQNRGLSTESAKIGYLIERVRASHFHFIRNDVSYKADKAAEHLAWKYGLAKDHIKTARDFIKHVATKSLKSGLLYMVQLPDGQTYPVGEMLTNELNRLDTLLKKQS